MFEAVFILSAVDAGTRVGRFFLQEMMGKVYPKFADKNWLPGLISTSIVFTGAWGYLVYSGDITNIWPLFGISNQLLASVTLLIRHNYAHSHEQSEIRMDDRSSRSFNDHYYNVGRRLADYVPVPCR